MAGKSFGRDAWQDFAVELEQLAERAKSVGQLLGEEGTISVDGFKGRDASIVTLWTFLNNADSAARKFHMENAADAAEDDPTPAVKLGRKPGRRAGK